ncbi:MAG: two-component regulator propeller domain-containing protein [Gracilimonas sp.]|nr:two-component regulator propeller domain-containing protein [Gracilimonas sp.]
MIRKGVLLLGLLCICVPAQAIQLSIIDQQPALTAQNWTLEDGLPVNTVGNITQDSLGYLWISTYDGLVRFDGLEFNIYNYSNTPEMPHNRTTLMYLQDKDRLWVSLEYGGVLLKENGNFRHFGRQTNFTDSDLTQIFESSDGRMFFITHSGLYVFDGEKFAMFYNSDKPAQNQLHDIFEDHDKSIWVATNNGLLQFNPAGDLLAEYHKSPIQQDNRFWEVLRTSNGIITTGTDAGVYELQDGDLVQTDKYAAADNYAIGKIYNDENTTLLLAVGEVFYKGENQIVKLQSNNLKPTEYFKDFYSDSNGRLWLIGTSGSLSLFEEGEIRSFTEIPDISDYYFNSVFEDREGNIWFGTNANGLIAASEGKVRSLGTPEGLSGNNILAMYEDSRKRYWVGTRGAGLNLIDGDSITYYDVKNGAATKFVQAIGEDRNGNIWFGHHQKGLNKITPNGLEHYVPGNNVEINDIRSIYTHSNGEMWLGTYGGLIKFDPSGSDHVVYGKDDGLTGIKIRYVTEAPDGAIWTGSLDGGVSRFHEGTFTNYTTEDGLSSDNIRSIYIDEYDAGTIWIGSENNGLNRLKDGNISYINMEDGLPDHIIHWISQDDNGWLWMSSNRGVFKINKSELNAYLDNESEIFTLLHYGRAEGMRNPEGNGSVQEAGLRTSDGDFWFATQEGVAIFSQDREDTLAFPPTVLINSITAGGNSYTSDKVMIDEGYKSFAINFNALTFPTSEKARFRYRLIGIDDSWNEVSGQRSVSYNDVPAGDYTFEVLAANNNGIWSEKPAIASITVQPFFYEQPWFFILVLALITGGYFGATQIRYQYLVNKQRKLESIIQEQTTELRQERNDLKVKNEIIRRQAAELKESNKTKDKFFSLIAHDLRTPFQGLVGITELLLMDMDEGKHPELRENVNHLYSSARWLHNFAEDLLSWASLQNGKMRPELEDIHIDKLVTQILKLFKDNAQQKDIELSYVSSVEINLHADRNMLKTIFRNLISNAIKFTEPGGIVSLHISQEDSFLVIKVKDDGIGMEKDMMEKLLHNDSNDSREGTQNEKGSGLGLQICKEMIALHDGKLEIESEVGKGTSFIVKLPHRNLSLG